MQPLDPHTTDLLAELLSGERQPTKAELQGLLAKHPGLQQALEREQATVQAITRDLDLEAAVLGELDATPPAQDVEAIEAQLRSLATDPATKLPRAGEPAQDSAGPTTGSLPMAPTPGPSPMGRRVRWLMPLAAAFAAGLVLAFVLRSQPEDPGGIRPGVILGSGLELSSASVNAEGALVLEWDDVLQGGMGVYEVVVYPGAEPSDEILARRDEQPSSRIEFPARDGAPWPSQLCVTLRAFDGFSQNPIRKGKHVVDL